MADVLGVRPFATARVVLPVVWEGARVMDVIEVLSLECDWQEHDDCPGETEDGEYCECWCHD